MLPLLTVLWEPHQGAAGGRLGREAPKTPEGSTLCDVSPLSSSPLEEGTGGKWSGC